MAALFETSSRRRESRIRPLGAVVVTSRTVLDTACAQIKVWHKNADTRDLTLSINVSARQFRQPDFVAQVRAAIERHSIDPMQLKIELTESLLLFRWLLWVKSACNSH